MVVLTTIGMGILGWTVGKSCDLSVKKAHKTFLKRVHEGKLDPNHDIERAVLSAHYGALQYLVNEGAKLGLVESGPGIANARSFLKSKIDAVQKQDVGEISSALAENWQDVVPTVFENAPDVMPKDYIDAALAELLSVEGWDSAEKQTITDLASAPDTGWATAFAAHMRQQLKENEPFQKIYMMHVLNAQSGQLNVLINALPSLDDILQGVEDIKQTLARIETSVNAVAINGHYTNDVGHLYPKYLAKKLLITDIPEELWEQEITSALARYAEGITQLSQQTNLPHELENKRKQALAFFEQAKLDEGEAILEQLERDATERFETAARDRARILIDRIPFATARLDFDKALSLYEQAAETVQAVDHDQAVAWLWYGGKLGRERGEVSGEPRFLKVSVKLYLRALALISDDKGEAVSDQVKAWATLQNSLGIAYKVQGERGDDEALARAIIAYKNALLKRTRKKTPMQWAMAQNNLGNVYRTQGERGDDEGLAHAVIAYENALLEYTRYKDPMNWAATQNNLGNVYKIQGDRNDDGGLARAVIAYGNASLEYTRAKAPMQWAVIQNNLGVVYRLQGVRGDDDGLAHAVIAYENALLERTREKVPMQWATTQNNLGTVYKAQGVRGDEDGLTRAVIAYENALLERTREKAPMQWAMTQNNLGSVYKIQGVRGDDEGLACAIIAYENALLEYTRDKFPMNWAFVQENLGRAFWGYDKRQDAENCFRKVLAVYREEKAEFYINKLEGGMRKLGLEP